MPMLAVNILPAKAELRAFAYSLPRATFFVIAEEGCLLRTMRCPDDGHYIDFVLSVRYSKVLFDDSVYCQNPDDELLFTRATYDRSKNPQMTSQLRTGSQ